jgi:hypothetical protein
MADAPAVGAQRDATRTESPNQLAVLPLAMARNNTRRPTGEEPSRKPTVLTISRRAGN